MYSTSARFRKVVSGSHRAVMRARIMSTIEFGANPTGGLELPLASGNVTLSSTSDIKGSLDCTVSGDYWDTLKPYGVEIFVERGVDYGDGTQEYVPLGYYRVQKIAQAKAPAGAIRVTAKDRIAQMKDSRLVYPYAFANGISHRQIFSQLVNGAESAPGVNPAYPMYFGGVTVPIMFTGYDPDRSLLSAGVVQDDIYEFLSKIADARGCVLRFARTGELVVEPRDLTPGTPPVYTVAPGAAGNLISVSRELTRDGVYNLVVARGSDPAVPTGYRLAWNEDTESALYLFGPFGSVPRYYSSPLLRTSQQADDAAETILSRYKGLPSGLSTVIVPDPSLDPLDPISIVVGGITEDHLADEITIPLVGTGSGVQIATRTLNVVPLGEDDGSGGGGVNPTDPGGGGTTPGQVVPGHWGPGPGGGGGGATTSQTLGVGGIATAAAGPNTVLVTADSTATLNITTSGKTYDGQGHTVAKIVIAADSVTVQNFFIRGAGNAGVYSTGSNNTIQNCDIAQVNEGGEGDINGITFFGDGTQILYNKIGPNLVAGAPGGSHTDGIQTWNTSSKRASSNVLIKGNRIDGPVQSDPNYIHQGVQAEGKDSTDGGGGGTGTSSTWTISDNYFKTYGNQCLNFLGVSNITITRNEFAGSCTRIVGTGDGSTGIKYYSDNMNTGSFGSVGATVIAGAGPGATPTGTGATPIFPTTFPDNAPLPWFAEPSTQQVVPVANAAEFTSKLAAAVPGQTLVLSNGTYAVGILTAGKTGTATQPIVVKPLNPGGVKLASGGGIKITGQRILVKGLIKEFDDGGKTFSLEGSARFSGFDGCSVGPTSLGAADPTAEKSLHYYVGADASDCFISYCESKFKSRPGNGVLVDGNFTSFKACGHIQIDHMDIHDFGTEAVNDFEAIRYGVSTMQTTVVNSAIFRCVFTNIASEPEVISLKANKIESWGHTVDKCIGSLSIRHGDDNAHRHCYVIGPKTGSGGTMAGGARVYGKRNEITECYFENLNGSSYESTLTIDGGDTTSPTSGHQAVVGGKFANNLGVNCVTAIVIGEHYSIAPSGITVRDNDFVNCGGVAVKTVKAPTGTNTMVNNNHYATVAEAGLTGSAGGGYRKTGRGPRLIKLSRADVGPNGNRADGTGIGIGGVPGGTAGTTVADKVLAAQAILDRLNSGLTLFEDWTWVNCPAVVSANNGALVAQYTAETGKTTFDILESKTWLAAYVADTGGGTGGTTEPANSIAKLLKIGFAPGLVKVNIGIGYAAGDPRPAGVPSGQVHADSNLTAIENGLVVPGYFELTPDKTRARLTSPLNGGHTSGSNYPRTEFRWLAANGIDKQVINPNQGRHYVIARGRVTHMAIDKPELVLQQWHDASDDVAMIRMRNRTTVEAKLGDTVLGNLTTSFALGTDYTYMIEIVGDGSKCKLNYYWNGVLKFTTANATRTTTWYAKCGCYSQSWAGPSDSRGTPTDSSVANGPFVVELSGLGYWGTGDPEPLGLKP